MGSQTENVTTQPTIAAMQAVNLKFYTTVYLLGAITANDGGEGFFHIGAPTAANGGTIINDSAGNSFYRQTYGEPYSVKWFGAIGDGAANDYAAVAATFAAALAANDLRVFFPPGTYLFSGHTINLNGMTGIQVIGAGKAITILKWGSLADTKGFLACSTISTSDINFRDLTILGPAAANVVAPTHAFIGLSINPANDGAFYATQLEMTDVTFENCYADISASWFDVALFTRLTAVFSYRMIVAAICNSWQFTNPAISNMWLLANTQTCQSWQVDDAQINNVIATAGLGPGWNAPSTKIKFTEIYWEGCPADGFISIGQAPDGDGVNSLIIDGGELHARNASSTVGLPVIQINNPEASVTVTGVACDPQNSLTNAAGFTTLILCSGDQLGANPTKITGARQRTSEWGVTCENGGDPLIIPDPYNREPVAFIDVQNPRIGLSAGPASLDFTRDGYFDISFAGDFQGWSWANATVVGEFYTFVVMARVDKTGGNGGMILQSGPGGGAVVVPAINPWGGSIDPNLPSLTENWEVRCLPFRAGSTTFQILAASAGKHVQIAFAALYHGIVFDVPVGMSPLTQHWDTAAPGTGAWSIGDKTNTHAPLSGSPQGWDCSVAGSPGTWITRGNYP